MPTCYYFDEEHISEYLALTRTVEGTKQYMDKYVHGVNDFNQYLKLVGGSSKLRYLEKLEHNKARYVYPWAQS